MSKLLSRSLKQFMIYGGVVLLCSIPVYYLAINELWKIELNEHKIVLTPEAGREDKYIIIGAVTILTAIFFILLLGGFVLLNRRISRKLWRPFYHSLTEIRNFDLNRQPDVKLGETDISEFTELNKSLHKLISGNIAVFNQQKEFAENASHELQTPLAVVQSKLELLIQSKSLTSEQFQIIEEALMALARVGRINKNLLLLTKIDNSQFKEVETIDFSGLLENTVTQFSNFVDPRKLTVNTEIAPNIEIAGNKALIEILVNNLITNAIRHSTRNGSISISLFQKKLTIANPGELPLKGEQLFKRFATVSGQAPGTGLGLSLVKQISSRYGWDINYGFDKGTHVFSLNF